MAIPVEQFAVPSFAQSTPALSGVQEGLGLEQQLQQLMTMPAERQRTKAMADYSAQQAKFLPLKMAMQAAQQQQVAGRFGPAYQFSRVLMAAPTDKRMEWISNNPESYQYLLNQLGQSFVQQRTGAPSPTQSLVNRLLAQSFPSAGAEPQTMAPQPQQMQTPQVTPGKTDAEVTSQLRTLTGGQPQQIDQPDQQIQSGDLDQQYKDTLGPQKLFKQPANVLNDQMLANKGVMGAKYNARVENAVQMKKYFQNNRAKFSNIARIASEYAGAKGRGKEYLESWTNQNDDKLASLDTFRNTITLMVGQIQKNLEGMQASDKANEALNKMFDATKELKSNPDRALKTINQSIDVMDREGDSVIDGGEPLHKGVYKKIYGFKPYDGDYVQMTKSEAPQNMVKMRTPDGKVWNIPEGKVKDATSRGATRID